MEGRAMGTLIVIGVVGAVLNLALWGAVYFKLSELPASVGRIVQRDRVADETRALDTLQAMAAARLGGLVVGIQTYHGEMATRLNAQVAAADTRARLIERRASEAGVALYTATTLVRQLRGLLDDLSSASAPVPPERTSAPDVDPDDVNRATVEMRPSPAAVDTTREPGAPASVSRERLVSPARGTLPAPNDDDLSGDFEETMVADHPLPGVRAVAPVRKAPGEP
jgi:hypothetical protein